MKRSADRRNPGLVEAAAALEEELRRTAAVAEETRAMPLDSQHNLERAERKLAELGEPDARLMPLIQGLMTAVTRLVADQRSQAALLAELGEELRRRRVLFRKLMQRYAELARGAQGVSSLLGELRDGFRQAGLPAVPFAFLPEGVEKKMANLLKGAEQLRALAEREGFEDVRVLAEQLVLQLAAVRDDIALAAVPRQWEVAVH